MILRHAIKLTLCSSLVYKAGVKMEDFLPDKRAQLNAVTSCVLLRECKVCSIKMTVLAWDAVSRFARHRKFVQMLNVNCADALHMFFLIVLLDLMHLITYAISLCPERFTWPTNFSAFFFYLQTPFIQFIVFLRNVNSFASSTLY